MFLGKRHVQRAAPENTKMTPTGVGSANLRADALHTGGRLRHPMSEGCRTSATGGPAAAGAINIVEVEDQLYAQVRPGTFQMFRQPGQ